MFICSICGASIPPGIHVCPDCQYYFGDKELQNMERISVIGVQRKRLAMYKGWLPWKAVTTFITVYRRGNHTIRHIVLDDRMVIETKIRERR
jgi:hypothetical protein